METNTKLPDYSGITKGTWLIDGQYIVATTDPETYPHKYNDGILIALMLSDEDSQETNTPNKFEQFANTKAIASLPDLIEENEELKDKNKAYAKDYNSMVAEVQRLSRSNGELLEALNKILELPQTIGHAYQMQDISKEAINKASQ